MAYHDGPGTRLAHAGGGSAELGHTAEATRAEGQSFARLQDVGFLGCRGKNRGQFLFWERGSVTKKMNKGQEKGGLYVSCHFRGVYRRARGAAH